MHHYVETNMQTFILKPYLILVVTLCTLTSCSTEIKDYENSQPKLDIKTYFDGKIIAWGMVQDYSQAVTRRFCVDITGTWQGNTGTLDEKFYFQDGEVSSRIWTLNKLDESRYQGQASDVVGIATGQQKGFAFHWQYHLNIEVDGETYEVFLDDWMYQIDKDRVFNRTKMEKWGIEVAQIILFFDKSSPEQTCQTSLKAED